MPSAQNAGTMKHISGQLKLAQEMKQKPGFSGAQNAGTPGENIIEKKKVSLKNLTSW